MEISGASIAAAVIGGTTFAGGAMGFIFWKARQIYNRLESGEQQRVAKSEKEESEIRETLLKRYKELYELEKEKSDREISGLKLQIETLANQVRQLGDSQTNLRRENDELRAFNIRLQAEVAKNTLASERAAHELAVDGK